MTCLKRKFEFKNVLNNEIDGFECDKSIGESSGKKAKLEMEQWRKERKKAKLEFEQRRKERKKAKLELEQWMNKSSNDAVSNIIKPNTIIRVYAENQKDNIKARSNLKGLKSKLGILGKVIHQFEHILEANGIKSTDLALFECKYIKYVLDIMRGYESCNTRYFAHKTFEKALDCYIMQNDDNGDTHKTTNKTLMNELLKFKYLYGKGSGYINADYVVARTFQQTPTLSEDDLFKLHEFCDEQIMDYTEKIRKNKSISFIKIRQLLFTKMTVLNCRKTEDLSTLKINEYIDSMNKVPVNQRGAEHPTAVSSLEKEYFFIIRFENTDRLLFTPYFMPRKYKTVLTYLIDAKVREKNNINIKNEYVFPNSRNSLEHVKGDLEIKRVCQMSKLINNITASSVRRYINKKLSRDFYDCSISSKGHCEIRELLGLSNMLVKEFSQISKMLDLNSSIDYRQNVSENYKLFPCDESEKLMFYLHMKTYFKNLTEDDVPQILNKRGALICGFVSDPLQTIPHWIKNMFGMTAESWIIELLVKKEVSENLSNRIKTLFPDVVGVDFKERKDKFIFHLLKQITKEMFAKFTKGKAISEDVQTLVLAELAHCWQDDIPKEDQIENF